MNETWSLTVNNTIDILEIGICATKTYDKVLWERTHNLLNYGYASLRKYLPNM